jgi:hypothetical protein
VCLAIYKPCPLQRSPNLSVWQQQARTRLTCLNQFFGSYWLGIAACKQGFHLSALTPPITPIMKPTMNPPPVTTLSNENTIITTPHPFWFPRLRCSITAPNNTRTPHINPTAAISANGTAALLSDHGSVGKIHGNHAAAAPTATALQTIKIPAARDKAKALVGFPPWLIPRHSRAFLASSLAHSRILFQSPKS